MSAPKLGLALALLGLSGMAALAQDRVLYTKVKDSPDVMLVEGKITEENRKKVVVQTADGNRDIVAEMVVEITYFVADDKARDIYRKAENMIQTAGQAGTETKRKEDLGQAIALFRQLEPLVADHAALRRHVQFKIASMSAQRARNDRQQTKLAVQLLEKFLKDHPNSWQSLYADKLLGQLKK